MSRNPLALRVLWSSDDYEERSDGAQEEDKRLHRTLGGVVAVCTLLRRKSYGTSGRQAKKLSLFRTRLAWPEELSEVALLPGPAEPARSKQRCGLLLTWHAS